MALSDDVAPGMPPPPGHYAFDHSDTLFRWMILCVCVCLTFTTIPFLLRTYVRAVIRREWILEDWFASITWIGLLAYCGIMITVMEKHGGIHQWDLTKTEVHSVLYWFNMTSIEYGIEMIFAKLTILMIYRRVFAVRRWSYFDIILKAFEAILIMFYVSTTLVKVFECQPRARIWNRSLPGTCVNIPALLNTSGMFNFITDVIILLIPIKSVWNLKMAKKRKVQVVLVFTFGLIAPVFSIIGFLKREEIASSPDLTYNQPMILLWATAEVSTCMICICLPPLTLLFRRRERPGPTQSILNGGSKSLENSRNHQSRRKPKSGLDPGDEELLYGDYLELKEGSSCSVGGVQRPGAAYVTGIKGGARSHVMEIDGQWVQAPRTSDSGEELDSHNPGSGTIVKTVRIEQSYV